MKIAIEGCAHGELEKIYDSIQYLESKENIKVDLLICCGDFQSTRNIADLRCMACPIKYQNICTFYKYYSGEKTAPILTIFIGGNHEASNYLQELPYGGWVAPNIFYMGYANVVNVAGIRIGGISGIYKGHDFLRGHFEMSPYSEETKRSVYHIRNLEVFRLKQLTGKIDIFLSHDWPRGVYHYGDVDRLLKTKPFFREDIFENKLGSRPCEELLHHLKPSYWFAAHLHCKFAALVPHKSDDDSNEKKVTKFLALDKCLPRRKFLQVVDIPHDESKSIELYYDLEWLTILNLTNHLLSIKQGYQYMPNEACDNERTNFTPTEEEKNRILEKFNHDLKIPNNFIKTAEVYNPSNSPKYTQMPKAQTNKQTEDFCEKLNVDDPLQLLLLSSVHDTTIEDRTLPGDLTPEPKSGRTFIDSMLHDNSISTDEFSPVKSCSTPKSGDQNTSSFIRPLNLPAPKDTSFDDNDRSDVVDTSVTEQCSVKATVEDASESVNDAQVTTDDKVTTVPPVKKFKRRNADMYKDL